MFQNPQKEQNTQKPAEQGKGGSQPEVKGMGEKKEVKKPSSEETITELTETLKRLQAEFENFQKRSAKQNTEYASFANATLIEQLLPVLDSLEQGTKHHPDLVPIQEQLFGVLKKSGLAKINAQRGMHYNHETMECLLKEKDATLANDVVANVLMTGYLLNGKILRAAKVSINEKPMAPAGQLAKEEKGNSAENKK